MYLVRRPDGEYYFSDMPDEMDAMLNGNLGIPVKAFCVSIEEHGDNYRFRKVEMCTPEHEECFEIVDIDI